MVAGDNDVKASRVKTFFISTENLDKLLESLSKKGKLYVPRKIENRWVYREYSAGVPFEFNDTCAIQPVKSFLFVAREKVADYPSGEPDKFISADPITIVGLKPCDVRSLEVYDSQFLTGDYIEPFYEARRKKSIFITTECYNPEETCFCNMLDIEPYATEESGKKGLDMNISPTDGGYLVDALSEKGQKIVGENSELFKEAPSEMTGQRDKKRAELKAKLEEINKDYKTSKSWRELCHEKLLSDKWQSAVAPCVECGACLLACPTCHCFLLYDSKGEGKNERYKAWDGCIYSGYARMAGGANPRPRHLERFRYRFLHKYDYFVEESGIAACTGCGRCIRGCSGNIDVRKVFKLMDVKEDIPVNK